MDEQAYPQCIGWVLSVMHDFNSVSGMWSDSQLKGRGGRDRGKEQMKKEQRQKKRKHMEHRVTAALAKEFGVAFPHIWSCLHGFWKW